MDDSQVYELQQLCTSGALSQESLSSLIDAGLSVPALVRSDAAAMAQAKKAGLGMAERQKLKEALRRHRDEVLSSEEPRIVEVGDDAEAHHIVAAQLKLAEERQQRRAQEAEDAKGVEVIKNGAIRERYRWTQELPELTVSVELPPGTAKRDVLCKIGMQVRRRAARRHAVQRARRVRPAHSVLHRPGHAHGPPPPVARPNRSPARLPADPADAHRRAARLAAAGGRDAARARAPRGLPVAAAGLAPADRLAAQAGDRQARVVAKLVESARHPV